MQARWIAAWVMGLSAVLAGCGGSDAGDTPAKVVAALRAQAAQTGAVDNIEAARQLMDAAETQFPEYFPRHEVENFSRPFRYRYYPGTGAYLGVVTEGGTTYPTLGVYVMGGPFGNAPLFVGPLSKYVTPTAGASRCAATPAVASIGPFQTAQGDCFVHYPVPQSQIDGMSDGNSLPYMAQLLADLSTHFSTGFDVVLTIVPTAQTPYSAINFVGAGCTNFALRTTCNPTLGVIAMTSLTALQNGPSLHELLHGYVVNVQNGARNIVPSGVGGHWGASSVGGQLGGFDGSTLKQLPDGSYTAARPPYLVNGQPMAADFWGEFANGGNTLPYANLELFLMGLLPREQLQPVTYAVSPSVSDSGTFTAASIRTLSADQIYASLTAEDRTWLAESPKRLRSIAVLITPTGTTVDATTTASLNSDIDQFSVAGEATLWNPAGGWGARLYNFYTATGGGGEITFNRVSTLRKPAR